MIPRKPIHRSPFRNGRSPFDRWGRLGVAFIGATALGSLTLEYGFNTPPLPAAILETAQWLAVLVYLVAMVHKVATAPGRWPALKSCWPDITLLVLALVFVIVEIFFPDHSLPNASAVCVAAMQGYLAFRLAAGALRLNLSLSQSGLHPTRVLAITFGALIFLGTVALSLPKATHPHVRLASTQTQTSHILNNLFTATSATCVTGLVVYDTGRDYSLFGQIVILVLIQAGGLGIMIFSTLFTVLAGHQLSLKQSLALRETMSHRTLGELRRMMVFVVAATFFLEAVGAALLYPMWTADLSIEMRVFHSIFHAVSAFCNAGFALQSDSLVAYSHAWQVYGCVMPLIVVGGLGFPVLYELWVRVGQTLRRSHRHTTLSVRSGGPNSPRRLSLHSRIVLAASLLLIVIPTVAFWVFESAGDPTAETHASWAGPWLDSLFLSVTCRTAGFNTVPMDANALTPASHMLAAILMFVGGSPGSTAGGVKTVVVAVLLLGVVSTLRGRPNVEILGRTIPETIVRRAAVVIVVMFSLVSVVTMTLCVTEQCSLREALFETVSAAGTVGLSTGLTSRLTTAGRLVIMVAMFAGRLGPLTVLVALAGKSRAVQYDYPEEGVGIG